MYPYTLFHALVLLTSVLAAPPSPPGLSSIFPPNKLASILPILGDASYTSLYCPPSNHCGVVSFASGTFLAFDQGICMPIEGDIQSIYVGHCYCSLWSGCSGRFGSDEYIDGMMMCEMPRAIDTFSSTPRFISCGGLH